MTPRYESVKEFYLKPNVRLHQTVTFEPSVPSLNPSASR